MVENEADYSQQIYSDMAVRLKDLEEKQRILKDRLLLLGQNLIDIRENQTNQILELKKSFAMISQDLTRIKSFLETISQEFSKFARKDDLEILQKQAKMFQPLEFVRKGELEKLKSN